MPYFFEGGFSFAFIISSWVMDYTLLFLISMIPGTIFLGFNDVLTRKILARGFEEEKLIGIMFAGAGAILLFFVPFFGFPQIKIGFWSALIISVGLSIVSQVAWMRAFKNEEASLVSPLRLLTPPLVLITGFLILGETPSLLGAAGVFTTIIGFFMLMRTDGTLNIFSLSSMQGRPGILFGILGAFLFAISFPYDKQGTLASSALFFIGSALFMVGISHLVIASLFLKKVFSISEFTNQDVVLLICTLAMGAFLTTYALNFSLVAYASSTKRLWSLWAILFAGGLLHESNIGKKLFASAVMIFGIVITV